MWRSYANGLTGFASRHEKSACLFMLNRVNYIKAAN